MREVDLPRPAVTVATVVERDGAFLFVEEMTRSGLRLNQPAGHLEAAETLVDAAVRETLEETRYRVAPGAIVGIYRWQAADTGATFVRFAFAADVVGHEPDRTLDEGLLPGGVGGGRVRRRGGFGRRLDGLLLRLVHFGLGGGSGGRGGRGGGLSGSDGSERAGDQRNEELVHGGSYLSGGGNCNVYA
jgi:ADP-ribose pyrophosphatase YjhB (NUDIX family)